MWKIRFFGSFSIAKMEQCKRKVWNVFCSISHHHTLFSYIFSGSPCTHFIESSHWKGLLEVKKTLQTQNFRLFFYCKSEGMQPKCLKRLDQFDINIPCSATYFLEVHARVLLKVANKVWGKKNTENLNF